MAEKKYEGEGAEVVIARARDFWERYSKPLTIAAVVVILAAAGWFGYKTFVKGPQETKAQDAMFKAEEYYRLDSVRLALNGDGLYPGFLRVIDKYGGTKSGKLARFYAGSCYLKLGDPQNAIRHLKKFSTRSRMVQARAYKLLGDAHADLAKNDEAFDYYRKAARHFEEDEANSAEYLFTAAYFAARVLNNKEEAIELFRELKTKFPKTPQGYDADKYLAQLGVYETED
ncbi:MAG TPA: tetratricopeptide repeat protein [Chitinophagaceae bacterium]|nr:tetratricopeptide repeat protein [Chitinophagaceae bacterium]